MYQLLFIEYFLHYESRWIGFRIVLKIIKFSILSLKLKKSQRRTQTFQFLFESFLALWAKEKNINDLIQQELKAQACSENDFNRKVEGREVRQNMLGIKCV